MSYTTYKQYDSRWGKKNYNGSSSMATAGCGPSSVANLVYPIDHSVTPWTVAKYMKKHGYAVYNNGTDWDGIPAAMKEFGMENVKDVNVDSSMTKVWEYLRKGYTADFLFRKGSRGGVCWTTSGHYVAVTNYKVKNGKHYLYTRDSGGRDHDGWYCYETQMRGLIRKVWVGKLPNSKEPKKSTPKKSQGEFSGKLPSLPKRGYFKYGDTGDQVKLLQNFLDFYAMDLDVDGIFGVDTQDAVRAFQRKYGLTVDGKFGEKSLAKAKELVKSVEKTKGELAVEWGRRIVKSGLYSYKKWNSKDKKTWLCPICNKQTGKYRGWNCIGFVSAAYFHGAKMKTECSCSGLGSNEFFEKVTEESWKKRNGSNWGMISNGGKKNGKSIDASLLKPGDALICYNKDGSFQHIVLYAGDGKYLDSTSGRQPNIAEGKYKNLAKHLHVTRAFRPK